MNAEEAHRIGLINRIADHADDLIETMLSTSGHSQRESKAVIRRILDGQAEDDSDSLARFAEAFTRADFREGVAAFLQKRKANFE